MSVSKEKNNVITAEEADRLRGRVIDNRYRLLEVIGGGAFGCVMKSKDVMNNEMVAIKLQKVKNKEYNLKSEYNFFKKVGSDVDGFPRTHYFGKYKAFNFMVMELLGPNLQTVFERCGQQFSLKTIIYMFMQLLQRIEHVHNCNIIFQDIKPENFVLGVEGAPKENIIRIIDFGLAKEYLDPVTKSHIPMIKTRKLIGTTRYMSINCHLRKEQSRRDDLEAIGYLMMYFLRQGNLPWMGLKFESLKRHNQKILLFKRGTPIETLCYGYPDQFAEYLRIVRSLEFEEKPDYRALKALFNKLFLKEKLEDDGLYDWN